MDNSLLSGLSAGGIGGVVIAVCFLLYKCLQGKKLLSKCCGAEITVQNEEPPPPAKIEIIASTPQNTPVLTGENKERKMSIIQV